MFFSFFFEYVYVRTRCIATCAISSRVWHCVAQTEALFSILLLAFFLSLSLSLSTGFSFIKSFASKRIPKECLVAHELLTIRGKIVERKILTPIATLDWQVRILGTFRFVFPIRRPCHRSTKFHYTSLFTAIFKRTHNPPPVWLVLSVQRVVASLSAFAFRVGNSDAVTAFAA